MKKRYVVLFLAIVLVAVIVNLSLTQATDNVELTTHSNGVVLKAQGDTFTATITFKNTGKTQGIWSITAVFEGDSWTWTGTTQNLTLNAGSTKTLTWNGMVPANATLGSMARLVVYYGDSYKALDWWIQVVSGAELSIQSSSVQ
jgi:hypothetical protein